MNGHAYHFETPAQWRSCEVSGADAVSGALTPMARFASKPVATLPSSGAQAPAIAAGDDALWRDDAGRLHRAMLDDGVQAQFLAPIELALTPRVVWTPLGWWTIDPDHASVALFEVDALARALRTDRLGDRVLDIAPDCHGAVLVLCERGGQIGLVRIACDGAIGAFRELTHAGSPLAFASLPHRVLVLADGGAVVHLFERDASRPNASVSLGSLRPCFRATSIASDGRGRWLLAGRDGADFGGQPAVLMLDPDGALRDVLVLARPATGIAATSSTLLIAHAGGIDVHRLAGAGDTPSTATMRVITPLLHAPDSTDTRRWSRAQASVILPPGTSAELRIAEIGDPAVQADLQWSAPIVLQGADAARPVLLAAPMHDVTSADVRIRVDLRTAPNTPLPKLATLDVLYATPGMAERMPMIYRRQMDQPGDFLRALVGVLDTTTQETDARIGMLGALIDPETAPPEWLDQVARWLGLPWDDALDPTRKRCLVRHASDLSSQRGSRAGLDTLLRCLLPGDANDAPRFRIVDVDVDIGVVTLRGERCAGTRLPALLAGLPRSAAVLSRRAKLGAMRLSCKAGGGGDGLSPWRGVLRIEIVADALERARMQPWLPALIAAMVPVTARVRLHWRLPDHATTQNVLTDAGFVLAGDSRTQLGVDAVTGRARLPGFRSSTLG